MLDSLPAMLQRLRKDNGLTLAELGKRMNFTAVYVHQIETGKRPLNADLINRFDAAFGTTPLLATALAIEKGHPMLRRMLFGGTLGLAGTLLASANTAIALGAVLNVALKIDLDHPDWDGIADDLTRRYVLDSGPQFGEELHAHIMVAHQFAVDNRADRDACRCAARLTMLYGLWVGDSGATSTAHSLYATAATLADGSGDTQLRAHIRARAASRGSYEGWRAKQAQTLADQALSLDATGPAAVEAHGAVVHVAALTGQLELGRTAVRAAYAAADSMDTEGPTAYLRAASFDNYLECRIGSLDDAENAYARTHALDAVPLWGAEAAIYFGRALVRAGDVDGGARMALDAVRSMKATHTRVLGFGVRDVLAAIPAGVASEPVAALRGYASKGPAPWETIR